MELCRSQPSASGNNGVRRDQWNLKQQKTHEKKMFSDTGQQATQDSDP